MTTRASTNVSAEPTAVQAVAETTGARRTVAGTVAFVILLAVAAAILVPIVYAVLGGFKDNGQLAANPVALDPGPMGLRQLRRRPVGRERPRVLGRALQQRHRRDHRGRGHGRRARPPPPSCSRGSGSAAARRCTPCSCSGCCSRRPSRSCRCTSSSARLGLSGSLLGVALPQAAFGLPLSIVILRPFFRSIPMELEDAARMDGCGSFGFFWRVLLPLSRPALATVSVLAIVTTWNAFILPLVVLNSADQWTLPLGVMNFAIDVQLGRGADACLHRRLAHPGADLLRHRRAAHRGRPDGRIGEGLMATIEATYRDPALSVEARAADLLGADDPHREGGPARARSGRSRSSPSPGSTRPRLAALAADGIGQITRLAGSTNLRPVEVARTANAIQRYLVEGTRLGIPAIIHEECLHGLIAWEAPCFQQSIGAAASFDPDVVSATAATIRRRMLLDRRPPRARPGPRHRPRSALGPDRGDLRRGPVPCRGPRRAPTSRHSRDPTSSEGVVATAKHMVGHGLAEGGMNQAPAHIGERELRDEQLFPFEAAVRRSGIASVMPAYCDVDGVPCHASTALLTGILRDEWGFDGIVASDYIGVEMISTAHKLTNDLAEAAPARARGRRRRRAAADGRLRLAARGCPRGRPGQRCGARRERRARAPHEVPARACSTSRTSRSRTRRSSGRWRSTRRTPPARSPNGRWSWSRTTAILPLATGRRRDGGHRADRRQRPRPARRLQPPRPHGDPARDARGHGRARDRR